MAIHTFICDICTVSVQDTNTKIIHKCPVCGEDMRWDLSGNNISTKGDYNHVSDSLAINPDQIAEHKQLFPDIDVLPTGQIHFTSIKQQERYAEACGFYKKPQKIRRH